LGTTNHLINFKPARKCQKGRNIKKIYKNDSNRENIILGTKKNHFRFAYMENECDLWGTSPVSFPIFVVSSSCKRVSGRL
jgi:hypothetical protein